MTKRRTLLGLFGGVTIGLGMSSMAMAAEHNFNLQSFYLRKLLSLQKSLMYGLTR